MALFTRLSRMDAAPLPFTLDGVAMVGRAGDTLLTAILTVADKVRDSDVSGAPRGGFCQMGACQDCWIEIEGRGRVRACTTALEAGMAVNRMGKS